MHHRRLSLFLMLVLLLSVGSGMRFAPNGHGATSVGTGDDYGRIDAYARNTPESAARSINSLADYLTAPARTDMDKVRVVYAWLVSHVQYDLAAANSPYRQKYYSEKDYATGVLRKRKGLCTGYALLFKHLLQRAGVQAVCIRGYARTTDEEAGLPVRVVDHEWNAARIDGAWYLFDLAWAVSTADKGAVSNDFYFLTPPEQFVAQHLPTDARWQLLDRPVGKGEFDRFPKLYAAYFALGFGPEFPADGQLPGNTPAQLSFRHDRALDFLCTVSRFGQDKGVEVPVTVTRTGQHTALRLNVSVQGQATLRVYAAPRTASRYKHYDCVASFTVSNRMPVAAL